MLFLFDVISQWTVIYSKPKNYFSLFLIRFITRLLQLHKKILKFVSLTRYSLHLDQSLAYFHTINILCSAKLPLAIFKPLHQVVTPKHRIRNLRKGIKSYTIKSAIELIKKRPTTFWGTFCCIKIKISACLLNNLFFKLHGLKFTIFHLFREHACTQLHKIFTWECFIHEKQPGTDSFMQVCRFFLLFWQHWGGRIETLHHSNYRFSL
jgi:hypothetical protein